MTTSFVKILKQLEIYTELLAATAHKYVEVFENPFHFPWKPGFKQRTKLQGT